MTAAPAAHISGRGSAPPGVVAAYAELVATDRDLLTFTEIYSRKMARAIRKALGSEWAASRRGEYMTAWRKVAFRAPRPRRPGRLRRLSRQHSGRDAWRDAYVYTRHLIHRASGRRVIVHVGHLPAGVEMGTGWRQGATTAAAAHQQGVAAWGRLIARLAKRRPKALQVAAMDSNLDQRLPVWRGYLTAGLGLPSIFADSSPSWGTHGHRLIDTAHTDAPVSGVRRGPNPPPQMDHAAILYILEV